MMDILKEVEQKKKVIYSFWNSFCSVFWRFVFTYHLRLGDVIITEQAIYSVSLVVIEYSQDKWLSSWIW
jgi:hypothetical protein